MCCRGIFIRSLLGTVLGMSASSAGSLDLFGPVLVEMRECCPLGIAIHAIALLQNFEVDVVGVELRPVDAGELAVVADQNAAAAAHARAVDHDRVETDHG